MEGLLQDVFIALFMVNTLSVAMHNTQPIIEEERKDKANKYRYKFNISQCIGSIKNNLILALNEPDEEKKRANS